jgi:hypothetical protein
MLMSVDFVHSYIILTVKTRLSFRISYKKVLLKTLSVSRTGQSEGKPQEII